MTLVRAATLSVMVLASPTWAADPIFQEVTRSVAEAIDIDQSGAMSKAELKAFGEMLFRQMDRDGSGDLSRSELLFWDGGLRELAAARDRAAAFDAEMGRIFDGLDKDGDGLVDLKEQKDGLDDAMAQADRDGDGELSFDEYETDYPFSRALKDALGPAA